MVPYQHGKCSRLGSNWLVEVNAVDADGKPIYALDGKMLKTKIQMQDATIADGAKQFQRSIYGGYL